MTLERIGRSARELRELADSLIPLGNGNDTPTDQEKEVNHVVRTTDSVKFVPVPKPKSITQQSTIGNLPPQRSGPPKNGH